MVLTQEKEHTMLLIQNVFSENTASFYVKEIFKMFKNGQITCISYVLKYVVRIYLRMIRAGIYITNVTCTYVV